MTDVFEKYEFTGRLGEIYRDALARVRPNRDREGTKTGFPDDGKTPFEDAFERYPDEPYIVRLGGFSMKFVEFDRETQDEFIMRYSCYSQVS